MLPCSREVALPVTRHVHHSANASHDRYQYHEQIDQVQATASITSTMEETKDETQEGVLLWWRKLPKQTTELLRLLVRISGISASAFIPACFQRKANKDRITIWGHSCFRIRITERALLHGGRDARRHGVQSGWVYTSSTGIQSPDQLRECHF